MFKKLKDYFYRDKGYTTTISDMFGINSLNVYNRNQTKLILDKLNGYQYIAGDIVAKTVAAQKLRLYAQGPTKRSKYHRGKEQIIAKNIPVSEHRLAYLKGEQELCHKEVSVKTLQSENDVVEILQHPALDVIRNINPYSNQWQFLYTLTLAMQFYGNSYFQKVRYTNGELAEIWYVPPQNMDIIQGKTFDDFIKNYEWIGSDGQKIVFDPSDILDFKIPGIAESQVYGTSKVEVVWKYIGLLESSLEYQKAITDNVGRPDFLLIAEENAAKNASSLKRLEHKWNSTHFGPSQAGKMGVVPGKVKVEVLPRSDFDFDNDTSLVRAVARGFGLPEYKVLPSSAIKANDSTQEKDFMKETIDTYLTLVEEVLNQNFLSEYEEKGLFFAFDPVIKEDIDFKLKYQTQKTEAAHKTINEIRLQDGLEPLPGGDDLRYKGKSILSMDVEPIKEEPNIEENEEDKQMKEDISLLVKDMLDREEPKKEIEEVKAQPININITSGTEMPEIEEVIEE